MTFPHWWDEPRFSPGAWERPTDAWIDGDRLRWRFPRAATRELIQPDLCRGVLAKFVALETAPDGEVVSFARQYGPLGLCVHRLPAWAWHLVEKPSKARRIFAIGDPCRAILPGGEERLDWWREWAGRFAAMMRLAHAIHSDGRGRIMDWERVLKAEVRNWKKGWAGPRNLKEARGLFAWMLNHWLERYTPSFNWWFRIRWSAAEPEILTGGSRLFVALILQMTFAACTAKGVGGLAICSACGSPCVPRFLHPAEGRRTYCPDCRKKGAPLRDAQRAYRLRKAQPQRKRRPLRPRIRPN